MMIMSSSHRIWRRKQPRIIPNPLLVSCYWSTISSHEHSHTISMISRPPAHFINLGCWSLSFVFVDFWVLRWYASGRRHPEWCFLKFSPPFGRRLCSGLWLSPTVSGTSSSRWRRRRPESSWRLRRSVSCSRDHSQPIRDQYPSHVIAPSQSEATVSVSLQLINVGTFSQMFDRIIIYYIIPSQTWIWLKN